MRKYSLVYFTISLVFWSASGVPCDGVDNPRPESKAAVEQYLYMHETPVI